MSATRFIFSSLARFQSRILSTSLVRSFPASSSACLNKHRPAHSLAVQEPTNPGLGKKLNILFFCNSNNSLSQRLSTELNDYGHNVSICEGASSQTMVETAAATKPDLILCPFLTKRIPQELYKNTDTPCLIVHPGITGDRGMFSIDWALHDNAKEWGVTVLQADDEMDAGDIYGAGTFPITREATKSSLYMSEITECAVETVMKAIKNYQQGIPPQPLRYDDPSVKGHLQEKMSKKTRTVDWSKTAEKAAQIIRMSDTQPGAIYNTNYGESLLVYGAHVENDSLLLKEPTFEDAAEPGDVIAKRNGAVLIKTADGKGVWVSHMKSKPGKGALKLPATSVLPQEIVRNTPKAPEPTLQVPFGQMPKTFQEIWTTRQGKVRYVHFNFYNGAMSTSQCQRLESVLRLAAQDRHSNVVVLMGGHDYFSNGIHLNMIENAENPTAESWSNINAINDVVKEIFTMKNKLTIAALRGNAGAGGAMMPLAADLIWAHNGVVINPHYKSMNLHGSEYWTHFLPNRVGDSKALEITETVKPMLAKEAVDIGMYSRIVGSNKSEFALRVPMEAQRLANSPHLPSLLEEKKLRMTDEWLNEVEAHRHQELQKMKINFCDLSYHNARRKFVYH